MLASVFEERAEHLSRTELQRWTAYTPKDESIVEKLMGPGAKLVIGPRGCGKSTLLRTAYYKLCESRDALPVYVNYARSLALEPLFHKRANALELFRQWLVMKVVVGVHAGLTEMQIPIPSNLEQRFASGRALIRQLEVGRPPDSLPDALAPSDLLVLLETWAEGTGLRRCVLLLDDAAHAFSPEQQREFFEVFRELRSRRVSCKAAVYPGITSYSPNFHVGHEAELLQAWYRADTQEYLASMRQMVERRLPETLRAKLEGREELVDFLALAAFGLPRGFLNMLSQLLSVDEGTSANPTRQRAERAVQDHAESVRNIFRALSSKLPRFRHFVATGRDLEAAIVKTLRIYNGLQGTNRGKSPVIAIEEPLGPDMERMLNMLEYAGVVRRQSPISRGVKGRFQRYSIHHAMLISENALSLGKSYPVSAVIEALTQQDAHAFARTKGTALLGENFEKRCKLDLPPCAKCSTPRTAEEQHFCMKCGAELTNASVYEELLRAPLEQLPITRKKVIGIKKHTNLKTVQDVLLDDEKQSLRKVPYIGPVWSARIRTYAEEFVSV
jgi:hypothetical protein